MITQKFKDNIIPCIVKADVHLEANKFQDMHEKICNSTMYVLCKSIVKHVAKLNV